MYLSFSNKMSTSPRLNAKVLHLTHGIPCAVCEVIYFLRSPSALMTAATLFLFLNATDYCSRTCSSD